MEENRERRECECCDGLCLHEEVIERVAGGMPPEGELTELVELFKAFADGTRMRVLYALFQAELCVCDIAKLLGVSQSAISHQLRLLKQARLVKNRREGKTVYYSLADEYIKEIVRTAKQHLEE